MKKTIKQYAAIILMALCVCACKKKTGESVSNGIAVPMEAGTPDGPAITKKITTAGGTVQTADGNLLIEIPEGAVTEETNITIQPVTRKLESATGVVYRLGPSNVNFKKDIKITFHYTEDDLTGTTENDLYLAYQDAEGIWTRVVMTSIDKTNKTLTASTRHFSDWTIERMFYIKNVDGKYQLQAGEDIGLIAYMSDANEEDKLLSANVVVPAKNIDGWFVNGPGTINNQSLEAVRYAAPASIMAPTTVAIGVRIKNLVDRRHPDRPGNTGLVIVQFPIQLVPDEFFIWDFDGTSNVAVAVDGALIGTTTTLIGTALTGSISIWLNESKPGTYEMGSAVTPANFSVQVSVPGSSSVIYLSTYYNCNEPTPRYGKGKLTISKFGSIGGFIEGEISATVYARISECQNKSRQITGRFKTRRKA